MQPAMMIARWAVRSGQYDKVAPTKNPDVKNSKLANVNQLRQLDRATSARPVTSAWKSRIDMQDVLAGRM